MEVRVRAGSPLPSVHWNSLERKKRNVLDSPSPQHQHHQSHQGQRLGGGSSSTTSLLQTGSGLGASSPGRSPPSPSSEIHQQLSLLTVPQAHSPLDEAGSSEGTLSPVVAATSSKFRRYSCNPPQKGITSSPQPHLRRSSLAAIKWSVLARRISMGMAHEREPPQDPTQAVEEVNTHVAQFRDLLIHIGQAKDGPEMREKIRRIRRQTIESCRHACQILLVQVRNDVAEDIPLDFIPQLVLLFFCTQLLLRELRKCQRLVLTMPLDMSSYYENRPGPSNLGQVLSQILLCRQINPDFNQEELCSIEKDTEEILSLLDDMQEFMPKETAAGEKVVLTGEDVFSKWARRRRRKHTSRCEWDTLCCISKSRRLTK